MDKDTDNNMDMDNDMDTDNSTATDKDMDTDMELEYFCQISIWRYSRYTVKRDILKRNYPRQLRSRAQETIYVDYHRNQ
jgi:hypothetical protein